MIRMKFLWFRWNHFNSNRFWGTFLSPWRMIFATRACTCSPCFPFPSNAPKVFFYCKDMGVSENGLCSLFISIRVNLNAIRNGQHHMFRFDWFFSLDFRSFRVPSTDAWYPHGWLLAVIPQFSGCCKKQGDRLGSRRNWWLCSAFLGSTPVQRYVTFPLEGLLSKFKDMSSVQESCWLIGKWDYARILTISHGLLSSINWESRFELIETYQCLVFHGMIEPWMEVQR